MVFMWCPPQLPKTPKTSPRNPPLTPPQTQGGHVFSEFIQQETHSHRPLFAYTWAKSLSWQRPRSLGSRPALSATSPTG